MLCFFLAILLCTFFMGLGILPYNRPEQHQSNILTTLWWLGKMRLTHVPLQTLQMKVKTCNFFPLIVWSVNKTLYDVKNSLTGNISIDNLCLEKERQAREWGRSRKIMNIKVFTLIEINFNIIRKISRAEKLFALRQQTLEGYIGGIFNYLFFKKVIHHGKTNTFQMYFK